MRLIQRAAALALAVLFLLALLVFASLALGIFLAVGLVTWGWLRWRSRPRGRVIEGEYRDLTPLQRLEEREERRL